MEMTTEQRNYLVKRLDEVAREKVRAKEVELFGEGGMTQPTWGTVFAAIKAGEITLKEGTENLTRAYLTPQDVEWPAMTEKQETLEAYKALIATERKKAMDKVMLGDAAKVIAEFEAL